ncbi:hypothetical protein [Streptomyces sp. NPDC001450]
MSPTASEKGLTVLDGKRPGLVTSEEAPKVPLLAVPNEVASVLNAARSSGLSDYPLQLRQFLQAVRHGVPDRHILEELELLLSSDRTGRGAYRRLRDATSDLREEEAGEAL